MINAALLLSASIQFALADVSHVVAVYSVGKEMISMDNYNNPLQPYQNGNPGYPPPYPPPAKHPGSGFATAALVLGVLSIPFAFIGTVYFPIIFSGLALLLGLLSRGSDRTLLPNAKVGLLTALLGFVINILVVASTLILLFTNPEANQAFHDQMNVYYERLYGESFDDALEEIRQGFWEGFEGE